MRTRPRFPEWSVEFNATFFPSLLNRSDVIDIFTISGFREGLEIGGRGSAGLQWS
jgi:hypothetical protein